MMVTSGSLTFFFCDPTGPAKLLIFGPEFGWTEAVRQLLQDLAINLILQDSLLEG